MSAFARLAVIARKPASAPGSTLDAEPMSDMERTALEAAKRAAPPPPAPVFRFASGSDSPATAGWLARIRATLSL